MSLINDALKRASQSSKQSPPPRGPAGGAPLQPVVGGRKRRTSKQTLVIVMSSIALLGVGSGLWAFLDSRRKLVSAPPTSTAVTPSEKMVTASPPESKPKHVAPAASPNVPAAAPAVTGTPNPAAVATPISTAPVSATDKPPTDLTPPSAPPAAAAAKPQKAAPTAAVSPTPGPPRPDPPKAAASSGGKSFPAVRLQGIVFRIKNPSVLINGKVLGLGEELDGMVVKKIERSAVTLEWNGQTKVISLK